MAYPPSYQPAYQQQPQQVVVVRRRKKRGGALKAVFVTLLVLAALVVAADRGAAWFVGRSITSQLTSAAQAEGGDLQGATVTVHGFPFLTQLVGDGTLDHISASLDSGSFGGVSVRQVQVNARGVQPTEPFEVDRAEVTALLPFATVQTLIAQEMGGNVALERDGSNLRITTSVLGLDVGAIVTPEVSGGVVRVDVQSFVLAGISVDADSLPFGVGDHFQNLNIPLQLPAGISLSSVSVEADGLRVGATGRNLELANLAF